MTRRTWLVLGLLAAAAAAPLAAAPHWRRPVAVVEAGPVADRVIARAIVIAAEGTARVGGPADGRVARVLVREGDRVKAGQALAEIEDAPGAAGAVRVVAPIAGAVIARRVDPGDSLALATRGGSLALFEIADTSRTEVRAEVEERDAARVAVGLAVTVATPGGRRAVGKGVVARLGESIERRTIGADDARVRAEGRVRSVWIVWEAPAPAAALGAQVEAEIHLPEATAAARLPRSAIVVRDGRTVVDARLLLWSREVAVEVGAADPRHAEVRGVAVGTPVFLPAQ